MLLTLGRGLAPAGRGTGVAAPPVLPRLTDLVPGLTANWEPYYATTLAEALTDTTGNGHHMTAVGSPALAPINATANGISLNGSSQYMTCNSLAGSGEDQPMGAAWVAIRSATGNADPYLELSNTNGTPFRRVYADGNDKTIFFARDDSLGSDIETTTGGDADTTVHVFVISHTGLAVTLYRDGTAISTINGASSDLGVQTLNQLWWGAAFNVSTRFTGTFAPCCYKNGGSFSGADVTAITGFLNARYGLF